MPVSLSWLLAGCMLLCGCSSDPETGPKVAPQPTATASATSKPDTDGDGDASAKKPSEVPDSLSRVGVDDRIKQMCNLPEARFDFDSASVGASAKNMLDKLAECFISGAGKGKNMRIVGHADQRGETEYNFALGQRRAGAVAGYLLKNGLAEERVATSSRGELEASGTDKEGWARDRRVEILLAE